MGRGICENNDRGAHHRADVSCSFYACVAAFNRSRLSKVESLAGCNVWFLVNQPNDVDSCARYERACGSSANFTCAKNGDQ
jgi:hypothetical protein